MKIRPATESDAEDVLTIYKPIVNETAVSFELTAPTIEQMRQRIQSSLETHGWLVAQDNNEVVGYAYASTHRPRQAYQFSVEVSAYVRPDKQGQGLARDLYQRLFAQLRQRQFHYAFAGIALPNDASIAFHQSMGFESIGVFRDVGFKFEKWHDVQWWQREI